MLLPAAAVRCNVRTASDTPPVGPAIKPRVGLLVAEGARCDAIANTHAARHHSAVRALGAGEGHRRSACASGVTSPQWLRDAQECSNGPDRSPSRTHANNSGGLTSRYGAACAHVQHRSEPGPSLASHWRNQGPAPATDARVPVVRWWRPSSCSCAWGTAARQSE